MTAILDTIDRLPTMLWAVVVMLSCWAFIAASAATVVVAIAAVRLVLA